MSNTQSWCVINEAAGERTAEISIRGRVGSWSNSVEEVGLQLSILDVDLIRVRINTLGGVAHEGIAIHNVLRAHSAKIETIVEGVAGSAGSVIAMAGDDIVMYANSLMMIHGAKAVDAWGDPVNTPESRAMVAAFNTALMETYKARTGKSEDELRKMFAAGDTWMTARQAVDAGFATRIEELHQVEQAEPAAHALAIIAAAAEIPADVLALAIGAQPAAADAEETECVADDLQADALPPVAPAETFGAAMNALAVDAGLGDYVAAWLLDGSITTLDAAREAIAEAREVRDLCVFAGMATAAAEHIRARRPLADVRAALINARAEADAATHTDGHPRSTTAGHARPGSKPAVSIASIYSTLNSTARH